MDVGEGADDCDDARWDDGAVMALWEEARDLEQLQQQLQLAATAAPAPDTSGAAAPLRPAVAVAVAEPVAAAPLKRAR